MGARATRPAADAPAGDLTHVYVVEAKAPIRVQSQEMRLTEWDQLGDKNIAYYTGERFFVIRETRK